MKVKGFTMRNKLVYFGYVCSKCGAQVTSSFKFCPMCRRELNQLPQAANLADVCECLTKALKDLPKSTLKIPESDFSVKDKDDFSGATSTSAPRCPRGKSDNCGCEFLDTDGTCKGIVFPTYPPQYDICPFTITARQ